MQPAHLMLGLHYAVSYLAAHCLGYFGFTCTAPSCRYGSKLYIGPPLVQRQRELMACLCEHLYVPYTIAPDLMTDAEVGGGV